MKLLLSKKIFFILLLTCTTYISKAQKSTEFYFNVLGGAFNYSGPGAANTSSAIFNENTTPKFYSESSYGKKLNFGFIVEGSATRVLANNFLLGASFGYQQFNSKTKFDSVITNRVINQKFPATGEANLKNSYVNLRPFLGKRVGPENLYFDFEVGTDLAFCLASNEAGSITGNTGNTVDYVFKKDKPSVDIRPTLGIRMQAKKLGILFRYSKGVSNYKNENGQTAHSNFIGLGLSFAMN